MKLDDADTEYRVLTWPEGPAGWLAEVEATPRPGPADLARWRRVAGDPDLVAAALRLFEARRKAAPKFARAAKMWLTPVGAEQATPEPIARAKADRFARLDPSADVYDLCSGIGGDSVALASSGRTVVAVDLDPGMARRVAWNAGVYEVSGRVEPITRGAEEVSIPDRAMIHADPDRRGHSVAKSNRLAEYRPPLPVLIGWLARAAGGAIKLGPASDFDGSIGVRPGVEIEVASLGGECKEATAWFGPLATPGVSRRATAWPSGATWTDLDGGPRGRACPPAPTPEPEGWAYDPDPALVRAGLVDGFALEHGLGRLAPGCDLLAGPGRVDSPFLARFEVVEVLPVDLRAIRRSLASRGVGTVDVKARGVTPRPEDWRRDLKLEGPNHATLIVVGGRSGKGSMAIVARRD